MRAPSTPISDERPRKTTSKCSLSLHQKPTIGQPNPRCVAGEGPKKTTEKTGTKSLAILIAGVLLVLALNESVVPLPMPVVP